MRTSINYSSFSQTTYYAVGKDSEKDSDPIFETFAAAVGKYPELNDYLESKTADSIMFRIPNDASNIQILVNKIAMISYQGCVYRDGDKPCKKCTYKSYCDIVKGVQNNDEC